MDAVSFMNARKTILSEDALSRAGIGTLGEKTLHRILKSAVEPDTAFHEIPLCGSVADVFKDGVITEIQTSSFERLVPKLKKYLPEYKVHVLYPIPRRKYLSWIKPATGEITPARTSPKTGKVTDVFSELWKLSDFLPHENLTLELVFLDVDEFRYLDGWDKTKKHGSTRMERIPRDYVSTVSLTSEEEYRNVFFPDTLPTVFSAKDYKKEIKCSCALRWIYSSLRLFLRMGVIRPAGKRGRENLFTAK